MDTPSPEQFVVAGEIIRQVDKLPPMRLLFTQSLTELPVLASALYIQ